MIIVVLVLSLFFSFFFFSLLIPPLSFCISFIVIDGAMLESYARPLFGYDITRFSFSPHLLYFVHFAGIPFLSSCLQRKMCMAYERSDYVLALPLSY